MAPKALMPSIDTMQLPIPLHAPVHPPKVELSAGAAFSVIREPKSKYLLHSVPQLISCCEAVTVPCPIPDLVIVSRNVSRVNKAPTVLFPSIDTMQLPVPVHAPVHPAKKEWAAGVAVRVTLVPPLKLVLQSAPQ